MIQSLSILSIVLAIGLPLLDYTIFRPQRDAARGDVARARARGAERWIYILFLIALALMALSSILLLAVGSHMGGWMLILHMTIAPLFAVCVAALSLIWSGARASVLTILVLLASFLTIVSSLFMMMTWFGSDGQRILLNLHRVSSMVVLVAAAAQAGRLLLQQHAARTGD